MAKIYGQLEKAQLENVTADYAATVVGRIWFNTATTLFKVTDGTNVRNVLLAGVGQIVNADVSASAAIAGTKIAPNFGAQQIVSTNTTNQILLGTTNTTTINAVAPASSRLATIPALSADDTFVFAAQAQALTNKDLDGGTASNANRVTLPKNTLANLQALTRKTGTIAFATDTLKPYIDNGTLLSPIGSGSGSGNLNYLTVNNIESDFEDALITGWSTYANTVAAATPEVSPGGSPSGSFTFAASSSSPLRGTNSGLLTKPASNVQGTGIRTSAFTIDSADTGRMLSLSFDFDASSANYVAGDVGVFLSDGTNIITPSVTALPSGKGSFVAQFNTTTATSYRLIFHVTTTSALAYTIKLDNLVVGPQFQITAPAISDWQTFTPTFSSTGTALSFGTTATTSGKWRRIGDSIEVYAYINAGGSGITAGTGSYYTPLPNSLTIDTTKLTAESGNAANVVGECVVTDSGVSTTTGVVRYSNGTTASGLVFQILNSNVGQNIPAANWLSAANDAISVHYTVPVSNWTSNLTLATSREEYASNSSTSDAADTTSFVAGPAGSSFPGALTSGRAKRVQFVNPIQPTDVLKLEVQSTTGVWQPVEACDGVGSLAFAKQGSVSYGMFISPVSGSLTQVDVQFAQYSRATNGAYAGAGEAWNLVVNPVKWRLRKCSGVAVTQLSGDIIGVSDGSSAKAGYVGEYIFSTNSTGVTLNTAGTVGNVTSIPLTPGDWDVWASGAFAGTSVTGTKLQASIGTTTSDAGNSSNGTRFEFPTMPTSVADLAFTIAPSRVSLSAATTYYLNGTSITSVNQVVLRGTLHARRRR